MTDDGLGDRLREALDVAPSPDLSARIMLRLDDDARRRSARVWRAWIAGTLTAVATVLVLVVAPRTPVSRPMSSLAVTPDRAAVAASAPVARDASAEAAHGGGRRVRRSRTGGHPAPAVGVGPEGPLRFADTASSALAAGSVDRGGPDSVDTPPPSTPVEVSGLAVEPMALPSIAVDPVHVLPLETAAIASQGDPR